MTALPLDNDAAPASRPYPLEGIRVLDLTVALAGPFCTLMLAGLGAEVIKIEPPGGGDIARSNPPFYGDEGFNFGVPRPNDISLSILNRARGKKSITLDLKSETGRDMFMAMAAQSDVIVENLSEGAVDRLGVGYAAVARHNSRIIYASINGLGEASPSPGLKAMDIIIQALSGVMEVTGASDGPPMRCGIPIGDLTGPLFATSGILAALLHRGRTGEGQHVKVSLLGSLVSLVAEEHFDILHRAGFATRSGNHHERLAPFGVYPARDGHVAIAAPNDGWTKSIFDAMRRPELIDDPRFGSRDSRFRHAQELNGIIESWTRSKSINEIVEELCEKRRVPAVRVRTPTDVLADPKHRAGSAVAPLHHPTAGPIDAVGTGMPIDFSACRSGTEGSAPLLGQHNAEIYGSLLQIDSGALSKLQRDGIV